MAKSKVQQDKERLELETKALVARISEATQTLAAITGRDGEELQRLLNKLNEGGLDQDESKQTVYVRQFNQQIRSLASSVIAMRSELDGKMAELGAINEVLLSTRTELLATQQKLEATSTTLATITAERETFRAQAEELSRLRAMETTNAIKHARTAAKKISDIRARLGVAKLDIHCNQVEVSTLSRELDVAEHLRKQAFVIRSIQVYLRNMKKIETYGGIIELQAIADLHGKNIELWQEIGGYNKVIIKSNTIEDGATPAKPLCIFRKEDADNIFYLPVAKEFAGILINDEHLIKIPANANSLFGACVRALQILNNQDVPTTDKHLDTAAYSLRLEVCEYLSKNNAPLYSIFLNIINKIYAPASYELEQVPASSSPAPRRDRVYSIIENELPSTFNNQQFIYNICKIIGQHYPEISDADINASSEVQSISSYSSLEDEDDYAVFGDSTLELDLESHEEEVKKFFMGDPAVKELAEDSDDDIPGYRLARRYVDYIKKNNTSIGGPIEIQALADRYNYQIHVKAFTGQTVSGEPQYSNVFQPSSPKSNLKFVYLALVNAGTPAASFKRLNDRGEVNDIERGSDSVYSACQDIIGKDQDTVRGDVISNLKEKISGATYNPTSKKKNKGGISLYFDDYIYRGYKGAGNQIKEFDLIPADAPFVKYAHKLRATRKIIFRRANAILDKIDKQIKLEMQDWNMRLSSLATRGDLRLTTVDKFNLTSIPAAILELIAIAISAANVALGETSTSSDAVTYNRLQGLSVSANILSSVIYCASYCYKEILRTRAVRSAQENLIWNLPYDKISIIMLCRNMPAKNESRYKVIDKPFISHELLRNEWSTDKYSGLIFKLHGSDKAFAITKDKYVPRHYVRRNIYQAPLMISVLVASNFILTSVTLADVDNQARMAMNATDTTTVAPAQLSVTSPSTAYGSIALIIANALFTLANEYSNPTRESENEISLALKALQGAYADNQGKFPPELSALLQDFGVDASLSNALSSTPQMVNIQRSLFKAKQELREHIEDLKQTQNTELLGILENIIKMVDASQIEELHASSSALDTVTHELRSASMQSSGQPAASASTQTRSDSRRASGIGETLRRFSGILRFSSSSTKDVKSNEARPRAMP